MDFMRRSDSNVSMQERLIKVKEDLLGNVKREVNIYVDIFFYYIWSLIYVIIPEYLDGWRLYLQLTIIHKTLSLIYF